MIMLAAHAQRAFKISDFIEEDVLEALPLSQLLDSFADPIFLLDATALILHANKAASTLLNDGQVARRGMALLSLFDRSANAALIEALSAAEKGKRSFGAGKRTFPVRPPGGRKFVATVLSLTQAPRGSTTSATTSPVAAVCVREAVFAASNHAETVASLYGLTHRESAILAASVDIGSVSRMAATLELAESTIRTHLKSIFRKTGAARQADLVRLLAAMAGPFG